MRLLFEFTDSRMAERPRQGEGSRSKGKLPSPYTSTNGDPKGTRTPVTGVRGREPKNRLSPDKLCYICSTMLSVTQAETDTNINFVGVLQ